MSTSLPPAPILELLAALHSAGHQAVLVGGCVRDRLLGAHGRDWDVTTSASGDEILAVFPRAVPIGGSHGTAMVPSPCGPVDVTPFRARTLEADLGRRDFSLNAIAWDPIRDEWWDPASGRRDLERGVLRAPGDPAARLAEDPLRAIRAARLVASFSLRPDADLVSALPGACEGVLRLPAERVRSELDRLLEAPSCAEGIALLRATGIEAAILPGTAPDGVELIRLLPADRDLRLAAWLRGTKAESLLARWRFPKARARDVARVLAAHPVDEKFRHDAGARRLRRRAGSEPTVERMLALRRGELELAAGEPERLDALAAALERTAGNALRPQDLAISGSEICHLLDVPPGPIVGHALRYLVECVIEEPDTNTPERLADRLKSWSPPAHPPASEENRG